MRAVVVEEGLAVVREQPDPVPGAGEILIRIQAAGLNGADIMQRAGLYPAPPGSPPDILGLELAGEVAALGPGAGRFGLGDRVMAVVGGGGQAELAVVHERTAMPVPAALSAVQAGGFPEAFTVAHDAMFTQCGLRPGERLLVNGAAGGVGVACVQLAVRAGASAVASVRSAPLRARLEALGATAVDPADVAAEGPFDLIMELIGAPNLEVDLESLAVRGRIAVIGIGGGSRAQVDLRRLMQLRGRIFGSTLRARPLEEKAAAARLVERQVLPLVANGRIIVPVEATFALEDVQAAYARFEAGGKLGKIVLEVAG
jgi:NADPH:quinone reductase-like Zn-dependent oxidoreductase